MILTNEQSLLIIAAVAVATILTRFLPFILFPDNKETPGYILYLGEVLPFAAIGLLIVYCLKNVSAVTAPYGLPEALAIASIIALHLTRKSTLLSIGGGTAIYMALIQFVFV